MTRKIKRILWISLAVILLAGAAVAGYGYHLIFAPQFHPKETVYIYIDREDDADSVYHKLRSTVGETGNLKGFYWLAGNKDYPRNIRPGRYAIRPGDNALDVYRRLSRGSQEPINLTINSVRTTGDLARQLSRQLMIDSTEIASRLNDPQYIARLGYTPETLPALVIPETYQVYWTIPADDLIARLRKENERFWNADRLAKAQAIHLTPEEVVTLASIVEEETKNIGEMPTVAGLYLNRLRRGMKLEADPTVKYAMQDFGLRRVLNRHLETESPYNTYRNTELPPGPIRYPSKQAIESVLNYQQHEYLFMCAKEDFSGTHNFARTLAEHNRNSERYRRALNERKIFN